LGNHERRGLASFEEGGPKRKNEEPTYREKKKGVEKSRFRRGDLVTPSALGEGKIL